MLKPGMHLGPYEVLGPLGAGGMGEVYRARDTRLGRDVAIKVLPAAFTGDLERLRRFEQEARAASALNHPNILTVYDVGTHEGAPHLITELLEGETLRQRLIDGPLPVRKAVDAACQIARGLAAAHEKGIVHRDLKPENVFVTADGHVKILDFGIAKLLAPPGEGVLTPTVVDTTQPGTVMGTVAYMSPEHVRGLSVDQRSDIFSLGVVLYEMVTGRQAFGRDTAAETMTAILKEEPPDPTSVEAAVPAALSRAIAQCLEKSPKDRFQSAHDLALALQAAATPSRPVAAAVEEARAPAGWKRSTRLLVAVGAAVLILGALAAARLWLHRGVTLRPVNFRLVSTFPGSHRQPTFSPDGSMIAYVDDVDGVPQIWVKNLATGDPIRITSGAQGASFPRWSPKNDQIIFNGLSKWGEQDEPQGIWSVPPLGGERRQIVDKGGNASFSWDGERIVFERDNEIWTAHANGSDQHQVEGITHTASEGVWGPVFSPDGRWIAYFKYVAEAGRIGADIWLIPPSGGTPRRLTFDVSWEGGPPVWTPDSRAIVFPSMRAGALTLWRFALDGGTPEPVTTGAGEDNHPDISRDGRKLIYTNRRTSYALMLLDTASGEQRQLVERRGSIGLGDSAFSPAGDRIAFTGQEGTIGHLFTIGTNGRELRQVTDNPGEYNAAAQWSGDGASLYYYSMPDHSYRKIPVAGGRSVEVIPSWVVFVQFGAQVDPEGRRIVYTVIEGNHAKATFVRDLGGGRETRLPVAMLAGKWSSDGTLLLGTLETEEAFLCPATGAACTALGKANGAYWSGDNSRIFFHRPGLSSDVAELWVMSRDGRDQRRVDELHSMEGNSAVSISRRDQYAWVQRRPGQQELWLAELTR